MGVMDRLSVFEGAATANATITNGGSSVAQATGGPGSGNIGNGGSATATASSTAMQGGLASATAIAIANSSRA